MPRWPEHLNAASQIADTTPIPMPAGQVNGSTDKADINSVRTTSGMSPVVRD